MHAFGPDQHGERDIVVDQEACPITLCQIVQGFGAGKLLGLVAGLVAALAGVMA